MEKQQDFNIAIVRNIQTNDLYKFNGGNSYTNLRTGVSGEIKEELAQKILKINMEATTIISEFPMVGELINKLNLKIQK
jgi:hypothetical protein